jgi:glycosyltransferase involved in cell wall biosynthesis
LHQQPVTPASTVATRRPRVMMVVPQYPYPVVGGLERQAHELARVLVEAGHSVQVISGKTDVLQPRWHEVEGVPVWRIPWPKSWLIRVLCVGATLCFLLVSRRRSFDVVHLHQLSWFSLLAAVVARLLRKPVLAKVPGVGQYGLPGLVNSPLGVIKLAIVRRIDALVAMSRQSVIEMTEAGIAPNAILQTPNGIRVHDLPYASRDSDASAPCKVVFVGRISAEKSVESLLRVWQRVVRDARNQCVLELWGDGPLREAMVQLARELGIEGDVVFRGHIDRVREKLGRVDMFVLPSVTEGNSNAVLEAMAAGLPVVSTRVGGTPMQVGPDGSPFLCEPGDENCLYEQLLLLVRDPRLRSRAGQAMRRRVLSHFELRKIAETYVAAYSLLTESKAEQMCSIANPVITGPSFE